MLQLLKSTGACLVCCGLALAGAACAQAPAPATLPAGHYTGALVITGINPCEQYIGGVDPKTHIKNTPAFLTISEKGSTLLLEYEKSNTKAADYFQTSDGTLVLTPGHMAGGKRHVTYYYFDMPLKRDKASGAYVASGDFIVQDACEGVAPHYDATFKFKASGHR